jgi:hypothetical protein
MASQTLAEQILTQRMSYPELIERLQRRRHEWMSPKWAVNMSLELDHGYYPFDLVGGALTKRSLSVLGIIMLSTNSEHTQIKRALKNDSDFWVQCHTIDPTQDVIVLVEQELTCVRRMQHYFHTI